MRFLTTFALLVSLVPLTAQATEEVNYSGLSGFVVDSTNSNFDVSVEAVGLGNGSDNNIGVSGNIAATVTQSGTNGATLDALRIDDLVLNTVRGLSINFPVMNGFAQADISSGTVSVYDNGPSATDILSDAGDFSYPNYGINTYGTINWSVAGFGFSQSGSINLADFNPSAIDLTGVCTLAGDSLKMISDFSMVLETVQTGVPVLGDVTIITTLNGHIEAYAPFQEVPEPATVVTLMAGFIGIMRRKYHRR